MCINALNYIYDTQGSYVIRRTQSFFPGQLPFCKKAVKGLAARRIF